MGISASISRLTSYCQRYGFGATVRRAAVEMNRTMFSNRMVLFYCDLSRHDLETTGLPDALQVERKKSEREVSPADLEWIIRSWNSKVARRMIQERFGQGASLWMIKREGRVAGYGWTMRGGTVEPHYFHLGPDDVHLFDFYVFPEERGQGLNPLLVSEILGSLSTECQGRAFIEAAEWNHAQLASLGKTQFRRLGQATKFTLFGRAVVCWDESDTLKPEQECQPEPVVVPIPVPVPARRGKLEAARLK